MGPVSWWLNYGRASRGPPACLWAAPQSLAGRLPDLTRTQQMLSVLTRLSIAIWRWRRAELWRLGFEVLQTHALGAGASGGTFLWCEVWKVPHGPGIGLGKACLSPG